MFKSESKRRLVDELCAANSTINRLRSEIEQLKAENQKLITVRHCDNVTLCQNCKHGIKQLTPITFRTGEQLSGHVVCGLHTDAACKDYEMLSSQETNNNR